jgi:hypothetical protein
MSAGVLSPADSGELRAALREASQVVPLAWSGGSRRFSLQAPLTLPIRAGSYVLLAADDASYLGQVLERDIVERPGPTWTVEVDSPGPGARGVRDATVEMPIRMIAGSGELLARVDGAELHPVTAAESFREAAMEQAPARRCSTWAARRAAAARTSMRRASRATPSCAAKAAQARPSRSASCSSGCCSRPTSAS